MHVHPVSKREHSLKNFVIELATITMGVLIALSLESLVEWNHYRQLVNEARETITHEIRDNQKELEGSLAKSASRFEGYDNALRLADELIARRKSSVTQFNVETNLAEFQTASWQTAERTGALSHMQYSEVQKYARVYSQQEMYETRQRRTLEQVAAVLAILGSGDPHQAPIEDVRQFRSRLLDLKASALIEQQFATHLVETYRETLPSRD